MLLYSIIQSPVAFPVTLKYMTLNDLEGLFGIKFCFRASLAGWQDASSENNCVKTNKDRHILSAVQIFSRNETLKDSGAGHALMLVDQYAAISRKR